MATTQPTILQIVPELDTGGAELSTIEIAQAIVAGGGRALVASEGGDMAAEIGAVGGELIFFRAATKLPLNMWFNAGRLKRIIIEENVSLVHARSRAPAWSGYWATKDGEIPFVTTYHGAYSEKNRFKKFYNQIMASGNLVIANSQYTSDLVQSRYATPAEKLRVVYRGLDAELYDRDAISSERADTLRRKWGIDPSKRIILNVARLTHWKGQSVIIEAAQKLKSEGKLDDVVFVFAGSAQSHVRYEVNLRAEIKSANLESHFYFAGHVGDIPAALAISYLAVVASTQPEAFGRAAAEAQAMACPIISTNIGAPPETVRAIPNCSANEVTGWLIPPSDSSALAGAIAEALALTPEGHSAIGARGRTHVAANFSLENMKLRTLSVYDELLGTDLAAKFGEKTRG
ncbi:MAG: glycosyltransferase family 4 protein [Hyphomicrobiaceae bacterium]